MYKSFVFGSVERHERGRCWHNKFRAVIKIFFYRLNLIAFKEHNPNFVLVALCLACGKI